MMWRSWSRSDQAVNMLLQRQTLLGAGGKVPHRCYLWLNKFPFNEMQVNRAIRGIHVNISCRPWPSILLGLTTSYILTLTVHPARTDHISYWSWPSILLGLTTSHTNLNIPSCLDWPHLILTVTFHPARTDHISYWPWPSSCSDCPYRSLP